MFDELKERLKQITEFVESLPEKYREQCFATLLSITEKEFSGRIHPPKAAHKVEREELRADPEGVLPPAGGGGAYERGADIAIPAKVRTFLQRNKLTEDQLRKVTLLEGGEVHFINEPDATKIAAAQIGWSLLLALKQALLGGEFTVDAESVRSICIEKGVYDRNNFSGNFSKRADVFQTVPKGQGEPVRINKKGEEQLAELIKQLAEK